MLNICNPIVTRNGSDSSLSDDILAHGLTSGAVITLRKNIDNFRIIVQSRYQKSKNDGDTWEQRQIELKTQKIELEKTRLIIELNNKKSEFLKLTRKYEHDKKKDTWERAKVVERDVIELENRIYNKYSEYFPTAGDHLLGNTEKLQEALNRIKCPKLKKHFTADRPPNKLTVGAKNRIRELLIAMDRKYGKNQIIICLSLPGDTIEAKKALADYSPWVDNVLHQCIRDVKKAKGYKGCNVDYVDVWELQKRGALHKHIVIASNDLDFQSLRKIAVKIGDSWESILDMMATTSHVKRGNYAGNLPGIDMYKRTEQARKKSYPNIESWANKKDVLRKLKNNEGDGVFINIQRVQKSVARYLSKYLSKGSNGQKKDKIFNPVRWWQSSKEIKNYCKQYRLECTFDIDSDSLDILIESIKYLESENLIEKYFKNYWDIWAISAAVLGRNSLDRKGFYVPQRKKNNLEYSQINGKKYNKNSFKNKPRLLRINRKKDTPIELLKNGRRVAFGMQFICYPDRSRFDEINNFLNDIINILGKSQSPIPENKPKSPKLVNRYNDDISTVFNYKIWQINHKKYWDDLAKNSG